MNNVRKQDKMDLKWVLSTNICSPRIYLIGVPLLFGLVDISNFWGFEFVIRGSWEINIGTLAMKLTYSNTFMTLYIISSL